MMKIELALFLLAVMELTAGKNNRWRSLRWALMWLFALGAAAWCVDSWTLWFTAVMQ